MKSKNVSLPIPLVAEIADALRDGSRDIHEHLQVCIRNLHGNTRDGLKVGIPSPAMLVHERGIRRSEEVEAQLDRVGHKLFIALGYRTQKGLRRCRTALTAPESDSLKGGAK